MKTRHLLLVISLIFISIDNVLSQGRINLDDINYDKTVYIFYGTPPITKCDQDGTLLNNDITNKTVAPYNATFTVHRVKGTSEYIIRFKPWSIRKGCFEKNKSHNKNIKKALQFNYLSIKSEIEGLKSTKELEEIPSGLKDEAFFIISREELRNHAYIYNPKPKYEFSYGTISYLARMRPRIGNVAGRWSTDLNLGFTAGIKKNYGESVGMSLLAGLSITKINLDSVSTRGVVKSTSEKPALTPSLNLLFSYQNVSIGLGMGFDWLNEDSQETTAWIYNKRIFYCVGLGINIFRSSANENITSRADQ